MSFDTPVRTALQEKSTAYGFWLTLPSIALAKTVLRAVPESAAHPFSWVLIDGEHGLISDRDYYELTTAIASEGASPFIRVPCSEEWMIKRALDAGAHGVVTPMCHSEEDARQIVQFSKYPPIGTRGYGPMFATHTLPRVRPGDQYDIGSAKGLMVVVQIESKSGLEQVEQIALVEGVDVIFIGPFDLAKQTGMERGGEAHERAIQRILRAAHSAGKKAAIFCTDGEDARTRVGQGFDIVSVATDGAVLGAGMINELAAASEKSVNGTARQMKGY